MYLGFTQSLWYHQGAPAHQNSDYLGALVSSYHTAAVLITQFYSLIGESGKLLLNVLIYCTDF